MWNPFKRKGHSCECQSCEMPEEIKAKLNGIAEDIIADRKDEKTAFINSTKGVRKMETGARNDSVLMYDRNGLLHLITSEKNFSLKVVDGKYFFDVSPQSSEEK